MDLRERGECGVPASQIVLSRETDSVPRARHHVRGVLDEEPVRDDVELVVTELVTNAVLHAPDGIIALRLKDLGDAVRVEVEDAGHGMPVAVRESTTAMTGRGLALVAALSRAWGVDSGEPGHKVVWAEVPREPSDLLRSEPELDLEQLLAGWKDEDDAEPRYEVRLGSVPTDLLLEAKAHVDNLVREFALANESALPTHLATLVPAVVKGFSEARVSIKEQALAAFARQDAETELVLHLHASAADAGEAYLAALDELDRYAKAARLLTLDSPPVHRVFRHWYVQSLVDQLRRQARGEAPGVVQTFPARLAEEVGELASLRPSVRRYTGLYEVASLLAGLTTAEEVADAVVRSGLDILGAHAGGLLATTGDDLQVLSAHGFASSYLEELTDSDANADLPGPTVLRTGEPLWVESAEQRDALFPRLRAVEPTTVSTCLVPLVAGRRLGVLRFSFDTPRLFDASERRYVFALADQAAVALQRAELFLAEQRARQDAELLASRLDGLMNVIGQLTLARTEAEITELAVRSATEELGAKAARVHLLSDGLLHDRAISSTDPELARHYPAIDPDDEGLPAHEALRTGRPLLLKDLHEIVARFPRLAGLYSDERALLLAPLIVDEHRLGVLTVSFTPDQEPGKQVSFVTSLADATAQALERVAATARAAATAERLAFLAEASVALSRSLDVTETLTTVAELVVPRMADWCSISIRDGDDFPVVALAHTDPEKVAWAIDMQQRYPTSADAEHGAPAVARTGVSELHTDIPDELLVAGAADEEHLRLMREIGMTSGLVVPLTGREGPFGAITMVMADSSRRFDADDVRDAEDLARRAALAVETVTAFAAQEGRLEAVTRVADAAQRAILHVPPSEIGPLHLAARYLSATAEALVGGDLYEVVRRPGAVRLLIGDVRGKGLEAVRNATIVLGEFRAAAEDIDDIVQVARQLDRRLTGHLEDEDFVTALLAEIADDGSYSLVSCGHPPPLLVSPTEIRALEIAHGLPLGLGTEPDRTTGVLGAGERLLLYTDGLIEARSPDGDFADVQVVVRPLQQATGLGEGLDGVLEAVHAWTGTGLGDDLALLAVSL